MNQGPSFVPGGSRRKTTWVVLCKDAAGRSVSEYVEGTELVSDSVQGRLQIRDGGRVVREYSAGAWMNFCEWVSSYSDFINATVIRLPITERVAAAQRSAADTTQRVIASAMERNTQAAISLLKSTLPRSRTTPQMDGAVPAPPRLPDPRQT